MIDVKSLSKKYGTHLAVDNVSFSIDKGEVVGFLGPNGAGKSTIMNIITGYTSSSSGDVSVCGIDVLEHPDEVKKRVGFLPEQPPDGHFYHTERQSRRAAAGHADALGRAWQGRLA